MSFLKTIFLALAGAISSCSVSSSNYKIEDGKVMYSKGIGGKFYVPIQDVKNFKILNDRFCTDNKKVYWEYSPIENANPETFVAMGNSYAVDKNYVFFEDKIVQGAQHYSFRELDYGYAKDKDAVYYLGAIIENADPQSFVLVMKKINGDSKWVFEDKHHIYQNGKVILID